MATRITTKGVFLAKLRAVTRQPPGESGLSPLGPLGRQTATPGGATDVKPAGDLGLADAGPPSTSEHETRGWVAPASGLSRRS